MNDQRRKQIRKLIKKLEDMRCDITARVEEITELQEEEQEYLYNMPESLQYADKGLKAEAAIDLLSEAASTLDSMYCDLEDVLENLNTAQE